LNGGLGDALWNGHPCRPRKTLFTCPERDCYHHHFEAAGAMKAISLHTQSRLDEGFFAQDWTRWLKSMVAAQWGNDEDPKEVFPGMLTPPLKRHVRLTPEGSGESLSQLYRGFISMKQSLSTTSKY